MELHCSPLLLSAFSRSNLQPQLKYYVDGKRNVPKLLSSTIGKWKKMKPEAVVLKNGVVATIRPLSEKESAAKMRDFINALVAEDVALLINQKQSVQQEKAWLKERLKRVKEKKAVVLVAENGGKIIATATGELGLWRESGNCEVGVAIAKKFRGIGLGKILLSKIISLAKEKLNPKKIFLSMFEGNLAAQKLYEKIGFREGARLPKWTYYKRKYFDRTYMVLK